MSSKNRKHYKKQTPNRALKIAIGAVSVLLVVLIVVLICLMQNKPNDGDRAIQTTQPTLSADQSASTQQGTNEGQKPTEDTESTELPVGNIPTESDPLVLEQGLYVVHMGNFSGRYVEDGSDAQLDSFCAVVIENRSDKTLQLLQFSITWGDRVYNFRLTTLPAGERAIVQDLNRTPLAPCENDMIPNVEMCLFFDEAPSLHEDIFAVSGTEYGIELRNLTDKDVSGPIYVYYKTRTADGYVGGITYRISIPALEANGIYNASVSHFLPGSSQVMFIEYAA